MMFGGGSGGEEGGGGDGEGERLEGGRDGGLLPMLLYAADGGVSRVVVMVSGAV